MTLISEQTLAMGRYRLGARLGAGGFGTVYAARDERLGRPVAIKLVPASGPAPERALREARAVARLDHDAIVALFDAGEENGTRYLVSELIEGCTLAELEAAGQLSDRDVLRIGLALADALTHAHERGVIHRDVKPHNVMVPDDPSSRRAAAKLTDFGVAQLGDEAALTHTGDVVGTLAYMAPEQAAGADIDERVDLYALALVLYEALATVNPVAAGSPGATVRRIGTRLRSLQSERPDLPDELCTAIDRALEADPDQRGSIDELFDALAAALEDVDDVGGLIAPHPLEPTRERTTAPARLLARVAPAALAGASSWAALIGLAPGSPSATFAPGMVAGSIAALVLVLPRLGWCMGSVAVIALLAFGQAPRAGAAVIVAALTIAPAVFLARADGRLWGLPVLAPLLGYIGLASAYPALAGRMPGPVARSLLGALGAWWLVLVESLVGRGLFFGLTDDLPPRTEFERDPLLALGDVIAPIVGPGVLALAAVWATAALLAPWLIGGRGPLLDGAGAALWGTGLAAATIALGDATGQPPNGLLLGVLAGCALALVFAHARR